MRHYPGMKEPSAFFFKDLNTHTKSSSIYWFISQTTTIRGMGQSKTSKPELHLGLLHGGKAPKQLSHLPLLSHRAGGKWSSQLGLDPVPIWDVGKQ